MLEDGMIQEDFANQNPCRGQRPWEREPGMRLAGIIFMAALLWAQAPPALEAQDAVSLGELTWTEVRDALARGKTTVIIPTGGTEQNGPHMVLGKHNFRVKFTSGEIARRLGDALVAPVMAYVPEGSINPPSGHMRFPGTISIPEEYFAKVVEYAARSFEVNGFRDIVLLGDSGPNQAPLKMVAGNLNREWASRATRVHYIAAYYDDSRFVAWLKSQGVGGDAIGRHAGLSDTSLLLPVYPAGVRRDKLAPGNPGGASGVVWDPRGASAAFGEKGLSLAITAAVDQIRELRRREPRR